MLRKLCFVLFAAAMVSQAAEIDVVEQIIAKVNGDIITSSELERVRELTVAELQQQRVPPERWDEILKERETNALRDQIDQLLLIQRGKDLGISVDPEVTRQIADIQAQTKITDPDKFQQYVREQSGMPYEDFRQQMRNNLLTRRVIQQEVGSKINIPRPEIEKYYEEHKSEFVRKEQVFLREIFLSTQGKTPEQLAVIEKKAADLVARARKGEKFPELARDNSDSESAKNFGELGWWKRGELLPQIEDIVFKEKRNFVSDPIKLDNGYLIVKLEERHEEGQASLDEVEQEIMGRLFEPKMQPRVREYLTSLRRDAFLEIREGYVDSAPAQGKDTSWKDPATLKPETVTKAEVAANRRRKLLWLIPLPGGGGDKDKEEAPATPAKSTSEAGSDQEESK